MELSPIETERLKVAVHRLHGKGSWDADLTPACEKLAKAVKKSLGPSPGSMLEPIAIAMIVAVSDQLGGQEETPNKAPKKAQKKHAVQRTTSRAAAGS